MVKSKDRQKIEELEKKIEELTNNWKRALADYANLEKRVKEEKEASQVFIDSVVLAKMLPILDNLNKAVETINDPGLSLVAKQFSELLNSFNVEEFGQIGESFDPNLHEVIATSQEAQNEKITQVFGRGYKIKDKILRPAKVKVGRK